ncbi:DsbA family protein [Taibaiella lutea]|uniref:DsbA family protein n=1 Tax=Taibaiella lutea TaxID=2608001 RepID=A0A5M6CFC4_9BACT|nr:DsbA family protein [Taibaiella lutea]KAA5533653.1 DsbA family protein [Taibaiella lutea]
MNLIYCYDAWCGWCYGFSPVIKKIEALYKDRLHVEVLSGGMILPEEPRHIGLTAPYIQQAYKTVEEYTGVKFGEDFLWHIFNPEQSDWFPNSEKPAIALCIIKEYNPDMAVSFAADLQYSLNFEGRDLTDDEAYRHLLPKYGIDNETFYSDLHSEKFKEKAYYDFALCKQLQVTSFPQLLLQASDNKFYLVAKGYTDFETLKERIDNILKELNA